MKNKLGGDICAASAKHGKAPNTRNTKIAYLSLFSRYLAFFECRQHFLEFSLVIFDTKLHKGAGLMLCLKYLL